MSTSVAVYAVPIDRLRAAPGSKDRKLLAALRRARGLSQMVQELTEQAEEGERRPPTFHEAVEQIIIHS